jgi:DNA-binding SARP family transcriptional activator
VTSATIKRLEFLVLGPLAVRDDDGRDVAFARPKLRALLAMLLLHANEAVSTGRLYDALWPDGAPATAGTALHGHVSQLRKRLGGDRIATLPAGYRIFVGEGELDAHRFETLVEHARRERDAAGLRAAVALWRGPAYEEFAFAWAEAERLAEIRAGATETRLELELEHGGAAALIPELEALVESEPYHERLRAALMLALYRAGRQADALAVYRAGRALLVEELGLNPSSELRQLERQILAQDPALFAPR